jgi:hypothetical protein
MKGVCVTYDNLCMSEGPPAPPPPPPPPVLLFLLDDDSFAASDGAVAPGKEVGVLASSPMIVQMQDSTQTSQVQAVSLCCFMCHCNLVF